MTSNSSLFAITIQIGQHPLVNRRLRMGKQPLKFARISAVELKHAEVSGFAISAAKKHKRRKKRGVT